MKMSSRSNSSWCCMTGLQHSFHFWTLTLIQILKQMTSAAASPGDLSKRSYWGCWWPARFCTCRGSSRICRACRSRSSRESTRLQRLQAHRCGKQQQLSSLTHSIYVIVKIAWVMCAAWKEKWCNLLSVPQNHVAHSCKVDRDPGQIKYWRVDFWITRLRAEGISTGGTLRS